MAEYLLRPPAPRRPGVPLRIPGRGAAPPFPSCGLKRTLRPLEGRVGARPPRHGSAGPRSRDARRIAEVRGERSCAKRRSQDGGASGRAPGAWCGGREGRLRRRGGERSRVVRGARPVGSNTGTGSRSFCPLPVHSGSLWKGLNCGLGYHRKSRTLASPLLSASLAGKVAPSPTFRLAPQRWITLPRPQPPPPAPWLQGLCPRLRGA